jgi:hypothetical protein
MNVFLAWFDPIRQQDCTATVRSSALLARDLLVGTPIFGGKPLKMSLLEMAAEITVCWCITITKCPKKQLPANFGNFCQAPISLCSPFMAKLSIPTESPQQDNSNGVQFATGGYEYLPYFTHCSAHELSHSSPGGFFPHTLRPLAQIIVMH